MENFNLVEIEKLERLSLEFSKSLLIKFWTLKDTWPFKQTPFIGRIKANINAFCLL